MSLNYLGWALHQNVGDPTAKLVLIGFCNSFDPSIYASDYDASYLAKFAGVTTDEVDAVFEWLVAEGWIERHPTRGYNLVWGRGVDPIDELIKLQAKTYPELSLRRAEPIEEPSTPPDWIYVLHCEGLVKVGISANVRNRIHQIRKEGPEKRKTKLFYKEQCTPENIRAAEKMAHGMLARRINRSDWFCDTPANAIMAVTAALAKVRGAV